MSIFLFKVKVNLPQGEQAIYFRRQSTTEKDGCFNIFCEDLLHRYEILMSMIFKITWIDNDGDNIRIFNEDDFLIFLECKGKKIIVNVYENPTAANVINGPYGTCIADQSRGRLNNLRASGNEVATAELQENKQVKNQSIVQKIAKDAGDYPDKQLAPEKEVRRLLTIGSNFDLPTINDLPSSGILQTLVKCLGKTDDSTLQLEATLKHFAVGTYHEKKLLVESGAVRLLLRLLASSNQIVCRQALWTLGRIISNDPNLRDYVVEHGIVQPLLKLIYTDTSLPLLIEIASVIRNLCRSNKLAPQNQMIVDIMPALKILIDHKSFEILKHIVWALSNIAYIGKQQVQMIIDHGFVLKLISLLGRNEEKLLVAALAVINNITAGSDQQTDVVLNCGALSYFPTLIQHPNEKIRKEVTWVLSNITGGTVPQIQAVIGAGLFPGIVNNLKTGEYMTKVNAAWAVSNVATYGNRNQVVQLVREGVLSPFFTLLTSDGNEHLKVVLRGIKNILKLDGRYIKYITGIIKQCNILEKIKELQTHEDIKVLQLAKDIVKLLYPDNVDVFGVLQV